MLRSTRREAGGRKAPSSIFHLASYIVAYEFGLVVKAKGTKKAKKSAWGMPVALGGDEGRDKLRKAAVRGKYPLTRGCPNGETRHGTTVAH